VQDGDILLAFNGEPVQRSPDRWLRDHQPGERVTVKVRRSGEEKDFSFALDRQSDAAYQVMEAPDPTEKQRRIRDGILHGTVSVPR
jgi:C-terminal processing protease CtpA/Prc